MLPYYLLNFISIYFRFANKKSIDYQHSITFNYVSQFIFLFKYFKNKISNLHFNKVDEIIRFGRILEINLLQTLQTIFIQIYFLKKFKPILIESINKYRYRLNLILLEHRS